MLDTLRSVTTPELIEVQLRPAGLLPRTLAWLIDFAIRLGVVMSVGTVLESLGDFGGGLLLLLYFGLEWFYPVLFEVLGKGATPGKRALNLVVVNANGTPIGWGASMTRNLLRTADFLPFAYGFGMVTMLCHREFRRLGDIVADTLVVYREKQQALPDLAEATPIMPTAPLDRATQRALVAFAERARGLTPARQEELADLVPHLAHDATGPQGAERLLGLANHLIGRRT
ncbi:RDD family protein [Uliginosibacterium sp. 31-16]|uniref:RDD family protein n=1 Tax=Uliginosibacterium sp. 31-16 TaxID=3068315 RepID=UPI00273E7E48|nr:RDD family protein [Uliginosibacterium sp. 31-16]MDP5241304.1 RDD family protein [Uliginosibacterium sp. 31-16]